MNVDTNILKDKSDLIIYKVNASLPNGVYPPNSRFV